MTDAPVLDTTEEVKYYPGDSGKPDPPYYKFGEKGEKIAISKAEYKKGMKDGYTRKYQTIPMCGHKFVPMTEPKHRNCEACWFAFFQVHGQLTQAVEEVYQKAGPEMVAKLRGPKFLKNFLKFMSTVAHLQESIKARQAEVKEQDDSAGSIESSNGEVGESYAGDPIADAAEFAASTEPRFIE